LSSPTDAGVALPAATGASLIGLTVMVTVVIADSGAAPSLARYVNVSIPWKLAVGVW
jgi:hypothetical protein